MVPLILAPILGKLAENGLHLLADAVTAKGKEVIEEKLGVSLDKSVESQEGLLKLKALEFQHEEFLLTAAQKKAETDLELEKLAYDDMADARDANVKIQTSDHSSYLAKNAAYWIDLFVVLATFGMAYLIIFQSVPDANKEIFYTAFGSLLTICLTIVQFHRGSSARSAAKDETISALSKGGSK